MPFTTVMGLSDVLIIYLSLGAPLAVHQFYASGKTVPAAIVEAVISGLFWVVLLPSLLHTRITAALRARSKAERLNLVRESASSIKSALDKAGAPGGYFEIRAEVESYLGISRILADAEAEDAQPKSEIFLISGHPRPELAAAILARRLKGDLRRRRTENAAHLLDRFRKAECLESESLSPLRNLFASQGDATSLQNLRTMIGEAQGPVAQTHRYGESRWETPNTGSRSSRSEPTGFADLTLMTRLRKEDLQD